MRILRVTYTAAKKERIKREEKKKEKAGNLLFIDTFTNISKMTQEMISKACPHEQR